MSSTTARKKSAKRSVQRKASQTKYRLVIKTGRKVVEDRVTSHSNFANFHRAVREMTADYPGSTIELWENRHLHTTFHVNKDGSYTFTRAAQVA